MKKSMLLLVAVCALLISAQSSFALTYEETVPYCQNWVGKWSIVTNHGTDNVTFDKICTDNQSCIKHSLQTFFWCQADGKRASDNKTILITQVSMAPTGYGYYEIDNNTMIDPGTPNDGILISDISLKCGTFKGNVGLNDTTDSFGLKSGKKFGSPDNCTDDNGTIDNETCTLTTVPKKIASLCLMSCIIIMGDDETEFTGKDKPVWDTKKIVNLLSVKISKKTMLAIVFVNPLTKDPGVKGFTVGSYCGTIELK